MSTRHRDFDAYARERAQDPLTFTLDGHEFTARPKIPVGPLLTVAQRMDVDESDLDAVRELLDSFNSFVLDIVVPEDRERFAAALEATDPETMKAVISWVMEESSGRPLGPSSSSPESESPNGGPSRVVSLAPTEEATRSA